MLQKTKQKRSLKGKIKYIVNIKKKNESKIKLGCKEDLQMSLQIRLEAHG